MPTHTVPRDSSRKSSETRPLPGAEMQQRGMRQMSCDSEAGQVTVVYRCLDMRGSIWSLRSMLDSGCYSAKDRCRVTKYSGKELDVTFSGGVFSRGNQTFKTVVEKEKRAGTQFDVISRGRPSNVDKSAGSICSTWLCGKRHVGRR